MKKKTEKEVEIRENGGTKRNASGKTTLERSGFEKSETRKGSMKEIQKKKMMKV